MDDPVRHPSVDVGKIARAVHDAADFQNVLVIEHHVVAEHAKADAFAELGSKPPSLGECDQSAAMFAQLLHKSNGARSVIRAI